MKPRRASGARAPVTRQNVWPQNATERLATQRLLPPLAPPSGRRQIEDPLTADLGDRLMLQQPIILVAEHPPLALRIVANVYRRACPRLAHVHLAAVQRHTTQRVHLTCHYDLAQQCLGLLQAPVTPLPRCPVGPIRVPQPRKNLAAALTIPLGITLALSPVRCRQDQPTDAKHG